MTIKRYVPNFVQTYEDEFAEVSSKEELLKVPFVARWAEDSKELQFQEFCIDNSWLIAFYRRIEDGSMTWYVVAKILDGWKQATRWFKKATYEKSKEGAK